MGGQKNQKWYQYHKYRYLDVTIHYVTVLGNFLYFIYEVRWARRAGARAASDRQRNSPDNMGRPGKRKADGEPAADNAARGGKRHGAGRKPKDAPGVDAAAAPKRKQATLGDLLGERFAKKQKAAPGEDAQAGAGARAAAITWDYVQLGGGRSFVS